jgi:hypothetical protein
MSFDSETPDGADGSDLPPEAAGRLSRSAFSSGLTVPDFAACLHMGMRPVGLVQGFCVMRWSWYGMSQRGAPGGSYGSYYGYSGRNSGTTLQNYTCPHNRMGVTAEHRRWGSNSEQPWVTKAWADGFNKAYRRMIEEAADAGAHGVVGIHDSNTALIDADIREFHLLGTAVVIEDAPKPKHIWTTYLAGQRLAKLIESGFMPVSILASMTSVRVWAICSVETLMRGRYDTYGYVQPGDEVTQLADAHMDARLRARDHIKGAIGRDALHGATMEVSERELGEGDMDISCILRGTRVHRVANIPAMAAPLPTVRLS